MPQHEMLMKFYARGSKFDSEKEKKRYKQLQSKDRDFSFYDTSPLPKEKLLDLIEFVQSKALEYYLIYEKSPYSDSQALTTFEKLSKELERLAREGNIDLRSVAPKYGSVLSFAKNMIEKYQKLEKNELEELRNFWKSDTWPSLLKDNKNCRWLVEVADTLRNNNKNDAYIICLGQSPSYWVMTAQILDILESNNKNVYQYCSFSGSFEDELKETIHKFFGSEGKLSSADVDYLKNKLQFHVDPLYSSLYKNYLKHMGINENSHLLICEQLELGFGLKSFLQVLPAKNYALYLNEYGIVFEGIALLLFPELKEKISYSFKTVEEIHRKILDECAARNNELVRLVAPFPKSTWLFADPTTFKPSKEAEDRILRIIDYIVTSNMIKVNM